MRFSFTFFAKQCRTDFEGILNFVLFQVMTPNFDQTSLENDFYFPLAGAAVVAKAAAGMNVGSLTKSLW
jgi:hypothetical protein